MAKLPLRNISYLLTNQLGYKILALLITIFLWVFIMGRNDAVETKKMAIKVEPPQDYSLQAIEPHHVEVRLEGNPKLLRRYFAKKDTLLFNVYKTTKNHLRLEITNQKLNLPFGISVVSVEPRYFDVSMQRKTGVQDPTQKR